MPETRSNSRRRYLIGGVVVIVVAVWLMLEAMGAPVPSWGRFWPIFALLGGVASAAFYFLGNGRPSALGKGVAGILFGLLLFAFTYDYLDWRQPGQWWPAVPTLFGAAFLANWFASRRESTPSLVLGVVGLGLGLTGFSHRLEWLEELVPAPAVVWSVLLLTLGILLVWRATRRKS